jgi:hypothetical protein
MSGWASFRNRTTSSSSPPPRPTRFTIDIERKAFLSECKPERPVIKFTRNSLANLCIPPERNLNNVQSCRIGSITVTNGQCCILRIQFQYIVVLANGKTLSITKACPEEEIIPTKYINGDYSSITQVHTFASDEWIKELGGHFHLLDGIYASFHCVTNTGRKVFSNCAMLSYKGDRLGSKHLLGHLHLHRFGFKKNNGIIGLQVRYVTTTQNLTGFSSLAAYVLPIDELPVQALLEGAEDLFGMLEDGEEEREDTRRKVQAATERSLQQAHMQVNQKGGYLTGNPKNLLQHRQDTFNNVSSARRNATKVRSNSQRGGNFWQVKAGKNIDTDNDTDDEEAAAIAYAHAYAAIEQEEAAKRDEPRSWDVQETELGLLRAYAGGGHTAGEINNLFGDDEEWGDDAGDELDDVYGISRSGRAVSESGRQLLRYGLFLHDNNNLLK